MKISKNKLNVALARKQWNQRDLRDNCRCVQPDNLEHQQGKGNHAATVGKIAAALGVDVTEIIEDEGNKWP